MQFFFCVFRLFLLLLPLSLLFEQHLWTNFLFNNFDVCSFVLVCSCIELHTKKATRKSESERKKWNCNENVFTRTHLISWKFCFHSENFPHKMCASLSSNFASMILMEREGTDGNMKSEDKRGMEEVESVEYKKLRQFPKCNSLQRARVKIWRQQQKNIDSKMQCAFLRCALNGDCEHLRRKKNSEWKANSRLLFFFVCAKRNSMHVYISKTTFNEVKATVNIISNALFQALSHTKAHFIHHHHWRHPPNEQTQKKNNCQTRKTKTMR